MLKTVGFPSTRTGDQTIVNGNLVIGTAGKGVDFSASSHASGMTSELLNDYEEGLWTPNDASGAGLTLAVASGMYTKVGRMVFWQGLIVYPTTADASDSLIGGFPFASYGGPGAEGRSGAFVSFTDEATLVNLLLIETTPQLRPYKAGGVRLTNAELSGKTLYIGGLYVTA